MTGQSDLSPAKPHPLDIQHFSPIRWLFALAGVALIALVGGYVLWYRSTACSLDALIASYRAAGEPVFAGDFVVSSLSDDQNAAIVLRRAAASIKMTREQQQSLDEKFDAMLPLSEDELKIIRPILRSNEAALALAQQARPMKRWDLGANVEKVLALTDDRADLGAQRSLARLLLAVALERSQSGDHAAAVELLLDALHVADASEDIAPTLVSHLVAVGINAATTSAAIDIFTPPLGVPLPRREQLSGELELVAALGDESALRQGWIKAMNGERATELYHFTKFTAMAKVASPLYRRDTAVALRGFTFIRSAGLAANWPAARAPCASFAIAPAHLSSPIAQLQEIVAPSLSRALETHFRVLGDRRMAAVAIAIFLYRVDHAGALPANLRALLPGYLGALPADPFATDGRSFAYAAASTQPAIYSVSGNGIDDGGSLEPFPGGRTPPATFYRWAYEDALLFLTRQPKSPASSDAQITTP